MPDAGHHQRAVVIDLRQAQPAVLLGHLHAQRAHLLEAVQHLVGDLGLALDLHRVDLLLQEGAQGGQEALALLDLLGVELGLGVDQVQAEVAHEQALAEARQLPVLLARVLGDLARFLLTHLRGHGLPPDRVPIDGTRLTRESVRGGRATGRRPIAATPWPQPALTSIGRARVQAQHRLLAGGRAARRPRRAGRRGGARRPLPDPSGRHRLGQDGHDGVHDREAPAPGAGDRPQQDAGRPAVQRVPRVLPGELGRVLRLLLRLLPARGLRPGAGPLHREGLLDQRGDRAPAPRGHRRRCSGAATRSWWPACRASSAWARPRSTTR